MRYHEIVGEDVFHGSPHRFDKFSIDHIDTGEGAQVYGWGLYFAGSTEVADGYRKKLSRLDRHGYNDDDRAGDVTLDGKLVRSSRPAHELTPEESAALEYHWSGGQQAAIEDTERHLEAMERYHPGYAESEAGKMELAKLHALKTIDFVGRVQPARGAFYTVEIPDDHYLLWDERVVHQPKAIRRLLINLLASHLKIEEREADEGGKWFLAMTPGRPGDGFSAFGRSPVDAVRKAIRPMTGKDAYKALSAVLGSDQAASLELNKHGIPGLKYLNGFARGQGKSEYSDDYNFVIFDDKYVKVKNVQNVNW